jgi:hypothetical protein
VIDDGCRLFYNVLQPKEGGDEDEEMVGLDNRRGAGSFGVGRSGWARASKGAVWRLPLFWR